MSISPVDRRRKPDRRRGADRRVDERRVLDDQRSPEPWRNGRNGAGAHIRQVMQVLSRWESLAPTEESQQEIRRASQGLRLAFQELAPVRKPPPPSRRGRWAAAIGLLGIAVAALVVFVPRGIVGRAAASISGSRDTGQQAVTGVASAGDSSRPPSPAPPSALDQAGESLATALQSYQDRQELFERKLVDCAGLASAFVAVNQRWFDYTLVRNSLGLPPASAAAANDPFYAADVDSVASRYERSGCLHP